MKYVVLACWCLGLASCLLAVLVPETASARNGAGMMVLGGFTWFIFGCVLGIGYKFVKWIGRS